MRFRQITLLLIICLLFSLAYAESGTDQTKRYFITLGDGISQDIVAKYGKVIHNFTIINAVSIELTDANLALLKQENGIKTIEEEQEIAFDEQPATTQQTEKAITTMSNSIQPLSYTTGSQWNLGETGINAEAAWSNFLIDGTGIKIAIIDTGINTEIPELQGRVLGTYSVYGTDPTIDTSGFGTKRATAMLADGPNVKGIAPKAQYYNIKITNSQGTFYGSDVQAGYEWAMLNSDAEIIFAGIGTTYSYSIGDLLNNSYALGRLFVGRNENVWEFPGRYDKIVGVGGYTETNSLLSVNGSYIDVVGPGSNVPVIDASGTVTTATGTSIAAAQVAGALALMVDYNRVHDLNYDNTGLWKALDYSSQNLWPGNSLAGWGKADVNNALTWMDQNWHLDYQIQYLNPDTTENGEPVYYFGSNVQYQLTIDNNSDKNFESINVTSYHIDLNGNNAYQQIPGSPTDQTTINNLLANSSQTVGPYSWLVPTTTEPGQKGTEIKLQIGPVQLLGAGPVLTMTENSFIIKPAPPGYVLHLTAMPSYYKEQDYYSGAATAKMILDYIKTDVNSDILSQTDLFNYGSQFKDPLNAGVLDFDYKAMDAVLGKIDPYDYLITDSFDTYDSLYDGNPYQGYNYSAEAYDTVLDYMKNVVHWMSWNVTQSQWWQHGALVQHPQTPAALPIFGTYNHWVALNGYAVSNDPTPDPYNPWTLKDFTIYGFWLTDPLQTGIGKQVYVTAAEAQNTYFLPMITNDQYNAKFLQIAEPPIMPPGMTVNTENNARIEIAQPLADYGNLEFVGAINTTSQTTTNTTGMTALSVNRTQLGTPIVEKNTNWKDLVDEFLLEDKEAVAAFTDANMQKPLMVDNLSGTDYYLIPFTKNGLATGIIMLDSRDGHFKQASWTNAPTKYLPINESRAIKIVKDAIIAQSGKRTKFTQPTTKLEWKTGSHSNSPFMPYWKIVINAQTWIVTQEGKAYKTA